MSTTTKPSRAWIKQLMEARGFNQRALATLWGVSEAAVSRFLSGLDSGDLVMSRAYPLSRMLGMDLEELAARLGFAGGSITPPALPMAGLPPVPTYSIMPHEGKIRVLVHLEMPPDQAGELLKVLASATIALP